MSNDLSITVFNQYNPVSLTNEIPHLSTYSILNKHLQNKWSRYLMGQVRTYFSEYESIKKIDNKISSNYTSEVIRAVDPETNEVIEGYLPKVNFEISGAFEIEMDYLMHEMHRYLYRLYPEHYNTLRTLTKNERNDYFSEALHMLNSFWDITNIVDEDNELLEFYNKLNFLTNITTARKYIGSSSSEEILLRLLGNNSSFSQAVSYIDENGNNIVGLNKLSDKSIYLNKLYKYYNTENIKSKLNQSIFANISDNFSCFLQNQDEVVNILDFESNLFNFAATSDPIKPVVTNINNILEYGNIDSSKGSQGSVSSRLNLSDIYKDEVFKSYSANKVYDKNSIAEDSEVDLDFSYKFILASSNYTHVVPIRNHKFDLDDIRNCEYKYIVRDESFDTLKVSNIIKLGKILYNKDFIDSFTYLSFSEILKLYNNNEYFKTYYNLYRKNQYNFNIQVDLTTSTGKKIISGFVNKIIYGDITTLSSFEYYKGYENEDYPPNKVWSILSHPRQTDYINFSGEDSLIIKISLPVWKDFKYDTEGNIIGNHESSGVLNSVNLLDYVTSDTTETGIPFLEEDAFQESWYNRYHLNTLFNIESFNKDIELGNSFSDSINTVELQVLKGVNYLTSINFLTDNSITSKVSDLGDIIFFRNYKLNYEENNLSSKIDSLSNSIIINSENILKLISNVQEISLGELRKISVNIESNNTISTEEDISSLLDQEGIVDFLLIDNLNNRYYGYLNKYWKQKSKYYINIGEVSPKIDLSRKYTTEAFLYLKSNNINLKDQTDEISKRTSITKPAIYNNYYFYTVDWKDLSDNNLKYYLDTFSSEYTDSYMEKDNNFTETYQLNNPTSLTEYENLILVDIDNDSVNIIKDLLDENKSLYINSSLKIISHVPMVSGVVTYSTQYKTISTLYNSTVPTYMNFYNIDLSHYTELKDLLEGISNLSIIDLDFLEKYYNRHLMVWGSTIWDSNNQKDLKKLRTIWSSWLSNFIIKDLKSTLPNINEITMNNSDNVSLTLKLDNYNYSCQEGNPENKWSLVYNPAPEVNSNIKVSSTSLINTEIGKNYLSYGDTSNIDLLDNVKGQTLSLNTTIQISDYNSETEYYQLYDKSINDIVLTIDDIYVLNYNYIPLNESQYIDVTSGVRLIDDNLTKNIKIVDNFIHIPTYWKNLNIFKISNKTIESFLERRFYDYLQTTDNKDIKLSNFLDWILENQSTTQIPTICYFNEIDKELRLALVTCSKEKGRFLLSIQDIDIPLHMYVVYKLFNCSQIAFEDTQSISYFIEQLSKTIYNLPENQWLGRLDKVTYQLLDENNKNLDSKKGFFHKDGSESTEYDSRKTIDSNDTITTYSNNQYSNIIRVSDNSNVYGDYSFQDTFKYFKEYSDEDITLTTRDSNQELLDCVIDFNKNKNLRFGSNENILLYDIKAPVLRSIYSASKEIQIVDRSYEINNVNVIAQKENTLYLKDIDSVTTNSVEKILNDLKPVDKDLDTQHIQSDTIKIGYKWNYPEKGIDYTYYKRKFITLGEISNTDTNLVNIKDTSIRLNDHITRGDELEIVFLDSLSDVKDSSNLNLSVDLGDITGPFKLLYSTSETTKNSKNENQINYVTYISNSKYLFKLNIVLGDKVTAEKIYTIDDNINSSNFFISDNIIYVNVIKNNEVNSNTYAIYDVSTKEPLDNLKNVYIDDLKDSENIGTINEFEDSDWLKINISENDVLLKDKLFISEDEVYYKDQYNRLFKKAGNSFYFVKDPSKVEIHEVVNKTDTYKDLVMNLIKSYCTNTYNEINLENPVEGSVSILDLFFLKSENEYKANGLNFSEAIDNNLILAPNVSTVSSKGLRSLYLDSLPDSKVDNIYILTYRNLSIKDNSLKEDYFEKLYKALNYKSTSNIEGYSQFENSDRYLITWNPENLFITIYDKLNNTTKDISLSNYLGYRTTEATDTYIFNNTLFTNKSEEIDSTWSLYKDAIENDLPYTIANIVKNARTEYLINNPKSIDFNKDLYIHRVYCENPITGSDYSITDIKNWLGEYVSNSEEPEDSFENVIKYPGLTWSFINKDVSYKPFTNKLINKNLLQGNEKVTNTILEDTNFYEGVYSIQNNGQFTLPNINISKDKTYTISFDYNLIKGTGNVEVICRNDTKSLNFSKELGESEYYKKDSITFTINEEDDLNSFKVIVKATNSSTDPENEDDILILNIKNLKLEETSTYTYFIPNEVEYEKSKYFIYDKKYTKFSTYEDFDEEDFTNWINNIISASKIEPSMVSRLNSESIYSLTTLINRFEDLDDLWRYPYNTTVSDYTTPTKEEYERLDIQSKQQVWDNYLEKEGDWSFSLQLRYQIDFEGIESFISTEGFIYPGSLIPNASMNELNRLDLIPYYLKSLVKESSILLDNSELIIYGKLKTPILKDLEDISQEDISLIFVELLSNYSELNENNSYELPFLLTIDLATYDVKITKLQSLNKTIENKETSFVKAIYKTNRDTYNIQWQGNTNSKFYLEEVSNLDNLNNLIDSSYFTTLNSNTNIDIYKLINLVNLNDLTDNFYTSTYDYNFNLKNLTYVQGNVIKINTSTSDLLGDSFNFYTDTGISFNNKNKIDVLVMVKNFNFDNFQFGYGLGLDSDIISEEDSIFEVSDSRYADFASTVNPYSYNTDVNSYEDLFLKRLRKNDTELTTLNSIYPKKDEIEKDYQKYFYNEKQDFMINEFGHKIIKIFPVDYRLPVYTEDSESIAEFELNGIMLKDDVISFNDIDKSYEFKDSSSSWSKLTETNVISTDSYISQINSFKKSYSYVVNNLKPTFVQKLSDNPRESLLTYPVKTNTFSINKDKSFIKINEDNIQINLDKALDLNCIEDDRYYSENKDYWTNPVEALKGLVTIESLTIKVINKTNNLPNLIPITNYEVTTKNNSKIINTSSDEIYIPQGGYGQTLIGSYTYPSECKFSKGLFFNKDEGLFVKNNKDEIMYVLNVDTYEKQDPLKDISFVYNSFFAANNRLSTKLSTGESILYQPIIINTKNLEIQDDKLVYINNNTNIPYFIQSNFDDNYNLFCNDINFTCKMIRSTSTIDETNNTRVASYQDLYENVLNYKYSVESLVSLFNYTRLYTGSSISDLPKYTKYFNRITNKYETCGGEDFQDIDRRACDINGKIFKIRALRGNPELTTNLDEEGLFVNACTKLNTGSLYEFTNILRDFSINNDNISCLYKLPYKLIHMTYLVIDNVNLRFVNNNNYTSFYHTNSLNNIGANYSNIICVDDGNSNIDRHLLEANFNVSITNTFEVIYSTKFNKYNFITLTDYSKNLIGFIYIKDYIDQNNLIILSNV